MIDEKKLIKDIKILKNQIYSLTKDIVRYTPTKCDNVSSILEKCSNIRVEIDSFQKGYNKPQTDSNESEFVKFLWENMQPNEMEYWQEQFKRRNDNTIAVNSEV